MEITIGFSSVKQIEFKFSEYEIKFALITYARHKYPDKLLPGSEWVFEWWDEDTNGEKLVAALTQRLEGPREDNHGNPSDTYDESEGPKHESNLQEM